MMEWIFIGFLLLGFVVYSIPFLLELLVDLSFTRNYKQIPRVAAVSLRKNNHNTDVDRFTVNNGIMSAGEGDYIYIPIKWKPRMKAKVSWYTKNSLNPNTPQTAIVEIPEYDESHLDHMTVHFYPERRVKVVVTRYEMGSPFYPLQKGDWPPYTVDQNIIDSYRKQPHLLNITSPTRIDRKWARQWGFIVGDGNIPSSQQR